MRKKRDNPEHRFQFKIITYLEQQYPEVLFTIAPAGLMLPVWIGEKLKQLGYRRGTPDILIFTPDINKTYNGWLIELKSQKGVVSKDQIDFLKTAENNGYKTSVFFEHNFDIFEQECISYFGKKEKPIRLKPVSVFDF